jgi:hypothetical protein
MPEKHLDTLLPGNGLLRNRESSSHSVGVKRGIYFWGRHTVGSGSGVMHGYSGK